jgi:hypothetical protein
MQADRSQPGNLCTGETVRAAVVRNDGDAVLGWKFHHVETVACSQRRMSKADINRPFGQCIALFVGGKFDECRLDIGMDTFNRVENG